MVSAAAAGLSPAAAAVRSQAAVLAEARDHSPVAGIRSVEAAAIRSAVEADIPSAEAATAEVIANSSAPV